MLGLADIAGAALLACVVGLPLDSVSNSQAN